MRWLMLGALIGLLLAFPPLLTLTIAGLAALATKPLVVAFGFGVAARPAIARTARGWAP